MLKVLAIISIILIVLLAAVTISVMIIVLALFTRLMRKFTGFTGKALAKMNRFLGKVIDRVDPLEEKAERVVAGSARVAVGVLRGVEAASGVMLRIVAFPIILASATSAGLRRGSAAWRARNH